MLRMLLGVFGGTPPPAFDFTPSSVPNSSTVVVVRVTSASSNVMFGSAARLTHGSGTLLTSALVFR
jgi:hypothetical protein